MRRDLFRMNDPVFNPQFRRLWEGPPMRERGMIRRGRERICIRAWRDGVEVIA
jgi:hypothetical protein